ncbi:MAG: hypothetical protein LUQ39_04255 [Methanomassiliicoccales archaeon]|nr:hypothetical protein [Methanomassiliicoccales archaeon]
MGEKGSRPANWNPGVGPIPDRMEKDLELELFSGLLVAAMKASIDAIGSERTMEFLTPYWRLMGKGNHQLFTELLPLGYPLGWDYLSGHFGVQLANLAIGRKMGIFYLTTKGAYSDMLECPYRDTIPELCVLVCYDCDRAIYDEYEGDLVPVVFRLEAEGRRYCRWIIKKRGVPNEDPFDVGEPLACLNLREVSPEARTFMVGAGHGNPWIHLTRSLVEILGREKAIAILGKYMGHFGNSLGLRLQASIQSEDGDALAANRFLEELNEAGHQKGRIVELSSEKVVKEITECPFSGSPSEIGEQLECFANGICEVISPEFEVTHPKAMCRGDSTCVRVISRKRSAKERKEEPEAPRVAQDHGSLISLLKSRLAKGEISLEEYRLLKEELSG